jgi:hypothetical protein
MPIRIPPACADDHESIQVARNSVVNKSVFARMFKTSLNVVWANCVLNFLDGRKRNFRATQA